MVRRRGIAGLVGACVIVMGAMSSVALARNYDGSLYLQPHGRTTLHLGIQLRHGQPYSFRAMKTGLVPLTCDKGEDSVRLNLNFPRHVPHPLIRDGRFRIEITDVGDGSTFDLWGVLRRRHAHGGLRYKQDDETHGHCSTDGRLVWLLHRD